jgi:hypothetical protein
MALVEVVAAAALLRVLVVLLLALLPHADTVQAKSSVITVQSRRASIPGRTVAGAGRW